MFVTNWISPTKIQKISEITNFFRHYFLSRTEVVFEIPVAHHADIVEIWGKDARIFEDGSILHDGLLRTGYLYHIVESLVQKVNLKIKRPSLHILVIIGKVWIVIYRLEVCLPAISLGKHLGQGSLAASYISCYCYMHCLNFEL